LSPHPVVTVAALDHLTEVTGRVALPDELAHRTRIVLRTARHERIRTSQALKDAVSLDDTFDEVTPESCSWRNAFLQRVQSLASQQPVLYVVPGDPHLADATVASLSEAADRGDLTLRFVSSGWHGTSSELPGGMFETGITSVDALVLADILSETPYAGGRFPFPSSHSGIVTNITSTGLGQVTVSVLRRRFPASARVVVLSLSRPGEQRITTLATLDIAADELPAMIAVEPVDYLRGSRAPDELQRLVARLRAPEGCPWDRDQTHRSLGRNLIEETYELLDAIEAGDPASIREELGDYLLQAYMHAQIAEENAEFTFEGVVGTVIEKLVRRHPHVFGTTNAESPDAVVQNWDEIKRDEREENGRKDDAGPLGRVPPEMPALLRAQTLLHRASRAGLSPDTGRFSRDVVDDGTGQGSASDTLVSRLVSVVNDANQSNVDIEAALRDWTRRFESSIAEERSTD
jgi:tetrapyrrole methylase family protein / MazG family protein